MPKFFNTDCLISGLKPIDFHSDEFSARINGCTVKRLAMSNEIYHHLTGANNTTKSRVWYYDPGFNKALTIAAVQPAGTGHKVLRNRSISSPIKLIARTLLAGLLAWFATWVLMAIPVLSWYGANAQKGVPLLETLSIQIGVAVAVLCFSYLLWVRVKINQLEKWQSGDISLYTEAIPPEPEPTPPTKPTAVREAAREFVE